MKQRRPDSLLPLVQGLLFLPVFLLAYFLILPWYGAIVLALVNTLTGWLSPSMLVHVGPMGKWHVEVASGAMRPGWGFDMGHELYSHVVFISLALLPPLLLATPVPLRQRMRLLAIALALVPAANVFLATVVVYTIGTACYGRFNQPSCTGLPGLLNPGSLVLTLTLWALLTWRHWFPASPDRSAASRRPLPRA